jgi:transposase InsO family protein
VSKDLRDYLEEQGMTHTRGRPYHPQTQGKIERYHRSMKNVVKLQHYYFPWELEAADVYYGRHHRVLSERDKIKQLTMQRRKKGVPGRKRGLGQNHEPSLSKRALLSEIF